MLINEQTDNYNEYSPIHIQLRIDSL